MRNRLGLLVLLAVAVVLFTCGCAKQYVITTDLGEPLESPARFRIGSVTDQLPSTVEAKDKPSAEDIEKFRGYLLEELGSSLKFGMETVTGGDAEYEVTGGIMQYTKGSGFLRFLIGFGAGSAKVLTQLKVVEVDTGDVVFAGNFEGDVTSWMEGGDLMFRRVAQNFAKELKRQHEKKGSGS